MSDIDVVRASFNAYLSQMPGDRNGCHLVTFDSGVSCLDCQHQRQWGIPL